MQDQNQIENQVKDTSLCFQELQSITHSKFQSIFALTTLGACYIAICEGEKESDCLRYLLTELGYRKISILVTLYADNQASINLSNNTEFHFYIKHIDLQFHWIGKEVSINELNIIYIFKAKKAADSVTKSLPASSFLKFHRIIAFDNSW